MKELAKETGFGQQLLLEIPAPKNLRLAYSSISLRAHFSAEHILSMMERAREIGRSKLSAKAKIMAARALEDSALNSSLCPPSSSEAGFPNCAETLIRDVENGVDLMVNSMEEMKKELENGDEKAATKAFARFGEAMLMNQFTFQTGLLLSEQSLPVDYILEGSEFQRFIGTAKVARGKILPAARQLMFGAGPDESTLETIAISPAF